MAKFRANQAGIRAAERTPAMQRAMHAKAFGVKQRAREIAPVQSGLYRASFVLSSGADARGAYGRVTNGAKNPDTGYPYAVAPMEFPTSKARGRRVLGRALDAVRKDKSRG